MVGGEHHEPIPRSIFIIDGLMACVFHGTKEYRNRRECFNRKTMTRLSTDLWNIVSRECWIAGYYLKRVAGIVGKRTQCQGPSVLVLSRNTKTVEKIYAMSLSPTRHIKEATDLTYHIVIPFPRHGSPVSGIDLSLLGELLPKEIKICRNALALLENSVGKRVGRDPGGMGCLVWMGGHLVEWFAGSETG